MFNRQTKVGDQLPVVIELIVGLVVRKWVGVVPVFRSMRQSKYLFRINPNKTSEGNINNVISSRFKYEIHT